MKAKFTECWRAAGGEPQRGVQGSVRAVISRHRHASSADRVFGSIRLNKRHVRFLSRPSRPDRRTEPRRLRMRGALEEDAAKQSCGV